MQNDSTWTEEDKSNVPNLTLSAYLLYNRIILGGGPLNTILLYQRSIAHATKTLNRERASINSKSTVSYGQYSIYRIFSNRSRSQIQATV